MPTPIRIDGETISGSRLQLISTSCDDDSDDSVELCLIHPDYAVQLRRRLLHIALFMTLYPLFVWWSRFRLIPADALAFGVALVLLHRVARLIQSETVLLAKHVALQASTRFAFGRTQHRLLLPVDSIHDVVVNEVIENLKVIYVLNVLTKGKLYADRPIIPLLLTKPRVDILEEMYQQLHAVLQA